MPTARPRVPDTLVLTRTDVAALLDMEACIAAVEAAFLAHAEGATLAPGVLGTPVTGGGFHVKTAGLAALGGARGFFVTKTNANFPDNPAQRGLPTVQGVISLHDATDGSLLALLDSMEITTLRTAAATAVAARRLARADARVVTVIGCGVQGRSQLRALTKVRRVERVFAWDIERDLAERYAREMSDELALDVVAVSDYRGAVATSDLVVTCTPSRTPLLTAADVPAGCFVAGVGADNEEKQELAPDLLARGVVVADVLEQCARIGDLHHAIAAGAMRREDVHAELADVVSGRRPGRRSAREVTVFDSTGTALEDVAAAVAVYERATTEARGTRLRLGD
jgi:ornithine cyclodeaminase/alanine dehydrogenase-like protein (mu-crystallin family)